MTKVPASRYDPGMNQPTLDRVLETGLYVDDLARSKRFYTDVFGLKVMLDSPRLVALDVGGQNVLLLFDRGESETAIDTGAGRVPGHGARGVQHFAFAIAEDRLAPWKKRLDELGIAIESQTRWKGGGQSIYLRDPDNHSVELVTPGVWDNY